MPEESVLGAGTTAAPSTATNPGTAPPAAPSAAPAATPSTPPSDPAQAQTAATDAKVGTEAVKLEFKAPEGVTLDQGLLDQFVPLAQELKLDQPNAQKIVDLYANVVKGQNEAWNKTQADWVNAAKADKEIGGTNFDSSLKAAKIVLEQFGTPALTEALNKFGFGNHPEVVRIFAKIGKAMGEDTIKTGKAGEAPREKSLADRLYGDKPKA